MEKQNSRAREYSYTMILLAFWCGWHAFVLIILLTSEICRIFVVLFGSVFSKVYV